MNQSSNVLAAAVLAIGMIGGAWALGSQFGQVREAGVITVKGLAEAEHRAGLGTWRVGVVTWGADYAAAMRNNDSQYAALKQFLDQQGFSAEEISSQEMSVGRHMEEYIDAKGERQTRENGYDAERDFLITTKDLAKLSKVQAAVLELRAQNEAVSFSPPKYYLEDLETIKRTLISQATQDAYVRAEEFAKSGKMKVGAMQSASQGTFDILSTSPGEDASGDYGGSYDTSTIDKKVRLVVTIQYRIAE